MPQLARSLHGTLLARNATTAPAARALARAYISVLHARRSYATTARATKPTATATVKKAVKTAAAKKPAPKKKATSAKKAAPAKKPVSKTVTRKTAAKKPAAKKAAPRKRVAKTPEEKEKAKIRELRVKALKEPVTYGAITAYNVYVAERINASGKGGNPRDKVADAAGGFESLTSAELEHYNHIANERTAARRAEYYAFIHSHTPDEIRIANNARNQLRRKLPDQKSRPAHTAKLHDDRAVKKLSPYNLFVRERHASADFKGIKPTEAIGLISSEWKALSADEKKKYQADSHVTTKEAAA